MSLYEESPTATTAYSTELRWNLDTRKSVATDCSQSQNHADDSGKRPPTYVDSRKTVAMPACHNIDLMMLITTHSWFTLSSGFMFYLTQHRSFLRCFYSQPIIWLKLRNNARSYVMTTFQVNLIQVVDVSFRDMTGAKFGRNFWPNVQIGLGLVR